MVPAFNKLIKLCTSNIVTLMQEVDETHPMDLEEREEDMVSTYEEILEVNYLDPLYGDESKISYAVWCERTADKPEVFEIFYQPEKLRSLTFLKAGIEFPEKAKFIEFCKEKNVHLSDK